jgi:hypothetical protein
MLQYSCILITTVLSYFSLLQCSVISYCYSAQSLSIATVLTVHRCYSAQPFCYSDQPFYNYANHSRDFISRFATVLRHFTKLLSHSRNSVGAGVGAWGGSVAWSGMCDTVRMARGSVAGGSHLVAQALAWVHGGTRLGRAWGHAWLGWTVAGWSR